jgi:hypothetical protein
MARPCFLCDGTGRKCICCGESAAICDGYCDPDEGGLTDCEECEGTGIASADLKQQREAEAAAKKKKKKK